MMRMTRLTLTNYTFAVCLAVVSIAATVVLMQPVLSGVEGVPPLAAQRQEATVTVRGMIADIQGSNIPGATVHLLRGAQIVHRTTSDANGSFVFAGVAPGAYILHVSLPGFVDQRRPITVTAGRPPPIVITLAIASLNESVAIGGVVGGVPNALPLPPSSAATPYAHAKMTHAAGNIGGRMPDFNTETYDRIDDNGWQRVADKPLSTFSVDVDTASYSNTRRFLNQGQRPPKDAVRIEELLNYFSYDYPQPPSDAPFSITTELGDAPWNARHKLVHIGLQGRRIADESMPPRNLVFLIDVSGSMMTELRLPLVKKSLSMLVGHLTERDRVAIVVYAGASGLVLPSTSGSDRTAILAAIDALEAGGSTNGGAGIQLAYQVASEHFIRNGVNRVVLATDGDFNVGVTNQGDLLRLIEQRRTTGIFLTVLGFGMGNVKDSTLEKLADRGNGHYAYIDSVQEAQKVLVTEAGATLVTIAKDVKLQVEFNPQRVAAYRLIGYENRLLQDRDFNDDTKDAGEIGAGHSVTALYEIVPAGVPIDIPGVDPLKYQQPARTTPQTASNDLLTVKIRYKQPDGDTSRLLDRAIDSRARMTSNLGFASSVAAFGMLLRDSEHKGTASFQQVLNLARQHRGADAHGHRAEFIRLVEVAATLSRAGTR